MAGLIGLVGCGSTSAGSPGAAQSPAPAATAPSATSPEPSSATPKPTVAPTGKSSGPARVCSQAGTYLTAVRAGEHSGYDRVVFQFSGALPGYTVERVQAVFSDPRGTPIPLAGQSYLRVVFRGTSAVCPKPLHQTYTGPTVLTPYYPQLLTVSSCG